MEVGAIGELTHSPSMLVLSAWMLSLRLLSSAKMEPRRSWCSSVTGLMREVIYLYSQTLGADHTQSWHRPWGLPWWARRRKRGACVVGGTQLAAGAAVICFKLELELELGGDYLCREQCCTTAVAGVRGQREALWSSSMQPLLGLAPRLGFIFMYGCPGGPSSRDANRQRVLQ